MSKVCRKTSQQIRVLSRLRNLIPTPAKLRLYKAAIFPHLTYCSDIFKGFIQAQSGTITGERLRIAFNNNLETQNTSQQKAAGHSSNDVQSQT